MHLSATLNINPWPRPTPEAHRPQSDYAERFWLPVIGPSSLWLLRWVQRELEDRRREGQYVPFTVGSDELALRIGLGAGTARQSPLRRSLMRLETFELGRRLDESVVEFRTTMPSVSTRQLERMPVELRREHRAWCAASSGLGLGLVLAPVVGGQRRPWRLEGGGTAHVIGASRSGSLSSLPRCGSA
ncbi:MAG: hypothetical protein IPH29_04865 [Candidatus Microthrix sp.]|nr:hypothetical protein [Candidatus Microthrix sp.]